MPEPELSHFEPGTNILTCALSAADHDDAAKGRKTTGHRQLPGQHKRGLFSADTAKDEPDEQQQQQQVYAGGTSSEELSNNIKKFKQDYEMNKLKKASSKKLKAMNNKYRGHAALDDGPFHALPSQADGYDAAYFNSEDEHNTSMDDSCLTGDATTRHNKNSSPSASISSSATSDCTSSTSSKHYQNPLQLLATALSANNNGQLHNQQNELFASLLSSLPNNLHDNGKEPHAPPLVARAPSNPSFLSSPCRPRRLHQPRRHAPAAPEHSRPAAAVLLQQRP